MQRSRPAGDRERVDSNTERRRSVGLPTSVRTPSFHGKPKAKANVSGSEQVRRVSRETIGTTLYGRAYEDVTSKRNALRSGGYRAWRPIPRRRIPNPLLASFHAKLALTAALHGLLASSLGGFHGKLDTVELEVRFRDVRDIACYFATTGQASMRAKRCSGSRSTSSVTGYADTVFQ
jgi:hypothetical protein